MPEYRLVLASMALLLGGCASQAKVKQADFVQLKLALPGMYGKAAPAAAVQLAAAQSAADASSALAVRLSITPVGAELIGDAVYFVRETAADNARLVLSQRIWSLAFDPHTGIVQRSFLFKEPRRWVSAADNPELLVSLLPADLQPLTGCELVWRKTATGFQTAGAPPLVPHHAGRHGNGTKAGAAPAAPQGCHPGTDAQGLWIEQSASLTDRTLTLQERRTTADGELDSSEAPLSLVLRRAASATPASTERP